MPREPASEEASPVVGERTCTIGCESMTSMATQFLVGRLLQPLAIPRCHGIQPLSLTTLAFTTTGIQTTKMLVPVGYSPEHWLSGKEGDQPVRLTFSTSLADCDYIHTKPIAGCTSSSCFALAFSTSRVSIPDERANQADETNHWTCCVSTEV